MKLGLRRLPLLRRLPVRGRAGALLRGVRLLLLLLKRWLLLLLLLLQWLSLPLLELQLLLLLLLLL